MIHFNHWDYSVPVISIFLQKHSPKGVEPLVIACAQDDHSTFLEGACNAHEHFPIAHNGIDRTGVRVQEYEWDSLKCLSYPFIN